MAHTLFISDVHLNANDPAITDAFKAFLINHAHQADALYILGDFFDVWLGDDDRRPPHEAILAALSQFTHTSRTPVYFIAGNHDFLVGSRFSTETGVHLLPDPTIINLYGTTTYLCHGDTLCTQDHSYQRMRRIVRWRWLQWLFLRLPLQRRYTIAQQLQRQSVTQTKQKSDVITDVNPAAVAVVFQETQAERLIHGHTHRPAMHENGRIVLGAWHDGPNYLRVDCDGHTELILL